MNKRLHHLERIICYEYKCFDTPCYPKNNRLTTDELHFMLLCNNIYYFYYVNYIDNAY